MRDKDPLVQLRDMRRFALDAIELLGEVDSASFAGEKMRFYAVTRAVELVGEAAAQVAREQQALFPTIPWSLVIGTRHRLIHGYAEVDPAALVLTVRNSLPALIAAIDAILGAGIVSLDPSDRG